MPFLEATDSARAKMIANTTTKSRYTPNALYKSGAKAWRNSCTQVTIVAIQVMYTGYTNLFINRLTNNRNDYVVTSNNEPNRKTHGQTVNNARRYGKTGAQAQS